MYCINCGKQIDGTIPVCCDCAMLVIQKQIHTNKLVDKIDIEAQEFSLKNENEPELMFDSGKKRNFKTDSREDDQIIYKIIITVAIILITLIVIFALYQR